jgi:DNA-binding CsgD family transcriptional regulator
MKTTATYAFTIVQLEIVKNLANGMTIEEIAKEVHRSKSGVNQILATARRMCGARTLPHLVSIVIAQGDLVWSGDERSVNDEGRR